MRTPILYFLVSRNAKKPATPGKSVAAFQYKFPFFRIELMERGVDAHAGVPGGGEKVLLPLAVLGFGPWIDRPVLESQVAVRDDQIVVVVDGVAEALAAGAGAEGVVEAEQARLRAQCTRCRSRDIQSAR
jgi:hypothetical protein